MAEQTKWQYKVYVARPATFMEGFIAKDYVGLVEVDPRRESNLEMELDGIGHDGWQLASTILVGDPDGRRIVLLFKRPAPGEGKPYY